MISKTRGRKLRISLLEENCRNILREPLKNIYFPKKVFFSFRLLPPGCPDDETCLLVTRERESTIMNIKLYDENEWGTNEHTANKFNVQRSSDLTHLQFFGEWYEEFFFIDAAWRCSKLSSTAAHTRNHKLVNPLYLTENADSNHTSNTIYDSSNLAVHGLLFMEILAVILRSIHHRVHSITYRIVEPIWP